MRQRLGRTCAVLILLSAFRGSTHAGESVAKTLDRYLSARTELGRFSGAVLVAKDGKVILRKGYGFADVARRIPYRPDTQTEVASISKMFTALATLKLRDRGKLALDDSICKYLRDCPDAWQGVTIRHLIYHQSGIPDYEERLEMGSDKYFELMARPGASVKILSNARTEPLEFRPGEKMHYSNTGYVVLSYVLESAAGISFERIVTEEVLKPARMRDSGMLGSGPRPDRLAIGYAADDVGWTAALRGAPLTDGHLHPAPELPMTPPEGDAWLYSTVDDLYKFSKLMEGSGLIPLALATEIETASLGDYGAGWFIDRAFDRRRVRHNGIMPGYVSEFIRYPGERTTIILFSNLDNARMSRIARDVTAIVFGRPFDMPVRGDVVELTDEQIARLVGDYVTADGKPFNVRKEPDYLTAELKGQYIAGLIPLSATEMYFPMAEGRAIFTLDAAGRATQVNMRYGGEDHVATRTGP